MEYNCVTMIGRLGRDPEGRDAGSSRVVNFSICSNRRYKVNGEQREDSCWIEVKAWGKLGELCETYLKKGSEVLVSGYLAEEKWEKDDQKRSKHVLVADKVSFGAKADGEEKGGGRSARKDDYSYAAPSMAAPASDADGDVEDDLPF
jgi:single-strand DNA-binding protein